MVLAGVFAALIRLPMLPADAPLPAPLPRLPPALVLLIASGALFGAVAVVDAPPPAPLLLFAVVQDEGAITAAVLAGDGAARLCR